MFLTENLNQAVGYCYRNEVARVLVAMTNSYNPRLRNTFHESGLTCILHCTTLLIVSCSSKYSFLKVDKQGFFSYDT